MKIVKKNDDRWVDFGSLQLGDVFIEHIGDDEFIQMKIEETETDGDCYNAVSLKTGELYGIDSMQRVEKVEAELVIS